MKKFIHRILLISSLFIAADSFAADRVTWIGTMHFGEALPPGEHTIQVKCWEDYLNYWVILTFVGEAGDTVVETSFYETASAYNTTMNILIYPGYDIGSIYPALSQYETLTGGGTMTQEYWINPTSYPVFAGGYAVQDTSSTVYYGATPTSHDLSLLSTNSLALTEDNPAHVEVWPTRSELAAASITENSRGITWHCILYDKNRQPCRDNAGNVVLFPVVPEWRKQTELYEEGE